MYKSTIAAQGTMYNPTDPDKPFTIIAVEDIGKASAAILVNPEKYANKTVTLVSDLRTYNDVAKAFSEALGKEIKYLRVPYEAAKKGMMGGGIPEWQAEGVIELSKLIDASSPALSSDRDLGLYKQITGEDPTDLKKWVTKYSAAFQ